MTTRLLCPACGNTAPLTTTQFRCACSEPLDAVHEPVAVSRQLFDSRLGRTEFPYDSGVWRFKELIHPDLPMDKVLARPEGNTPLFRAGKVGTWAGVANLRLKHEGYNPTGSFKDRGMTVAASHGYANGANAFVCASTGNTSAAVASYGALAGIPAVILIPENATAMGKISQALAYGARTVQIRGNFDDAMSLVQDAASELGLYLLNSLNPFRVQGQKTIMFELLQQLNWQAPDWIVFPAGNLGNTSAFGLALTEAHALGLIDRVPRMLAVQAAGSAPFSASFAEDFRSIEAVSPQTVATAIRIGNPVSFNRAVRSIRATNGVVTHVSDTDILEAKAIVDAFGIGAEPASCASVAGVRQMVDRGLIAPGDSVVALLTGHLLKDPDTTLRYHQGEYGGGHCNPPVTIDATLEALAAVVSGSENPQ
ncbi:MAG: threonine synthase [Rhodobacterales bacterium]|nr:threonine synthase [Rhodobacterales bacterium]